MQQEKGSFVPYMTKALDAESKSGDAKSHPRQPCRYGPRSGSIPWSICKGDGAVARTATETTGAIKVLLVSRGSRLLVGGVAS